jgi:hypothetical protein
MMLTGAALVLILGILVLELRLLNGVRGVIGWRR